MTTGQEHSNGATRVAYILGVPLAQNVLRQSPQIGEIVRTRQLVADVEGNSLGHNLRGDRALTRG